MSKKRVEVRTYDPRLGQAYLFQFFREQPISSLPYDFFVIEWSARISSKWYAELLNLCIPATSPTAFFTAAPWHPGAQRKKRFIAERFEIVDQIIHSVIGYLPWQQDKIEELLSVRDQTGGDLGEWTIGGCFERFERVPGQSVWDFYPLIKQPDRLSCVLDLGEDTTLFLCRPFAGFDDALRRILPATTAEPF